MILLHGKWAFFLLRIIIGGIIAGLFFWKTNISLVFANFNSQMLKSILLLQPIVLLCLFMVGMRFLVLVGKPIPPFRYVFKAMLLSYGLNNILPGRVSELLKVSYLKEHVRVPVSVGLAAVFLERMMDILFLGFMTLIGILIFFGGFLSQSLIILASVMLSLLFLIPFSERAVRRLLTHIPWKVFQVGMEDFLQNVIIRIHRGNFLRAFFFGLAGWVLSFSVVSLFLHLNGPISVGLLGFFAVFIGITVGVAIPALPGGFGTYETGAVFVLQQFGYSLEKALSLAIALHASQIILCVAGSLIVIVTEQMGILPLIKQAKGLAQKRS